MPLNSRELRSLEHQQAEVIKKKISRFPIYLILENILDTYNIGGFFRLADAIAAKKIYLCGETGTPPDPKITKASIGTYKLVPWQYRQTAATAITELRKKSSLTVLAVEQSPQSRDYKELDYNFPLAFIFGNESFGITPKTLTLADDIIELPMFGANNSLNVMVAAGIALYWALEKAQSEENS
jgi:tRNA G18 (ribose-2'-O)-methylase SpoU